MISGFLDLVKISKEGKEEQVKEAKSGRREDWGEDAGEEGTEEWGDWWLPFPLLFPAAEGGGGELAFWCSSSVGKRNKGFNGGSERRARGKEKEKEKKKSKENKRKEKKRKEKKRK